VGCDYCHSEIGERVVLLLSRALMDVSSFESNMHVVCGEGAKAAAGADSRAPLAVWTCRTTSHHSLAVGGDW